MLTFEEARPQLFAIAYRMLGSAADAEDAVQETFVRVHEHPTDDVRSEKAYLTTVVTRICLDVLKSARRKRETYVGPWLPEPIATEEAVDRDSMSLAFLVMLERLSPAERAAYLLVEVFDHTHAEAAVILEKEEPAVRKLTSRARAHMDEKRPRYVASREEHLKLMSAFVAAVSGGDLDGLKSLLTEDVAFTADGGGKARAARKIVHGNDDVGRLVLGLARKGVAGAEFRFSEVNGTVALVMIADGGLDSVLAIEVAEGRIAQIFNLRNPDKLVGVAGALGLPTRLATDVKLVSRAPLG